MKIYIDEELPKSCASCQFLVLCDQCEGAENYCPFVGCVGYDLSDNLITGASVTPTGERHKGCPLVQKPHGEWVFEKGDGKTRCDGWGCSSCGRVFHTKVPYFAEFLFCPNCGSYNWKERD